MRILIRISFVTLILAIGFFSQANAEELKFKVGEEKRDLILEYPENIANIPVPLVFLFHGGGGNSSSMQRKSSEIKELLLKAGYAVAFMNGSGRFSRLKLHTWNGDHCCGYAAENKINDVAYIDAAIDFISQKYLIDESNIFFIGHSNGGMISYKAAGITRHPIRGIVVVSSAVFADQPAPKRAFSMLMIHTKDDEIVHYTGGISTNKKVFRTKTKPFMAFEDAAMLWKKYMNCGQESNVSINDSAVLQSANCASASFIRVLKLENGGHEWNKKIEGISIAKIILQFIQDASKKSFKN
ncbi:MAG: alpha/beta fold hydrolase [Rickettsiales bacterium]